ncbi:MAG: DUF819 family protein [Spirochaetales bacterium]|nr:DUF819 family protein [Leptospiraceae bacterium]MCP5482805.1 DUF819 family protein [Spirochaetales bacterium]
MIGVALILFVLGLPALAIWLCRNAKPAGWLGPVVLCYLAGILLTNLVDLPEAANAIVDDLRGVVLMLAIPLLVFGTDFVGWIRHALDTVKSFCLAIFSVLVSASVAYFLLGSQLPSPHIISGMLIGVYTGGTPNMAIIGEALGAPEEVFVLVNASDFVLGGLYFLFLISVAKRLVGLFLRPFPVEEIDSQIPAETESPLTWADWKSILPATGLALFCALVSVGLAMLAAGTTDPAGLSIPVLFLGLTALGIGASFLSGVRRLRGTYESGEYLVLAFCVALGLLIRAESLLRMESLAVFAYIAAVMFGAILLHFFLAYVFRLDRDTVLITSTAAVFGPPFVAPVVEAIGNRAVLISGLTSGLVGFAVGNFLGISFAELLGLF